jgi:transcriptional regulator with XRE-family HTH domain
MRVDPIVKPKATETADIGSRLRAARKRLGWNRETLAYHSGISWSAIAQVEAGRRTNLRPSTLSALARPLGVTIDYLVSGGRSRASMLEHSTFLYDSDDQFQATMGSFLAEGIERSEAPLAMTTSRNIELLRERLGDDASRVEFVESSDWLSSPANAFEEFSSYADAKLEGGSAWVRILAEPIWAGRSDTQLRLWTRFESLVNVLFASSPVTFVCPYDKRSVPAEIVRQAHVTHPDMLSDAGISESPDYAGAGRVALDPSTG